ncbi:MAG: thiolase family protein [Candidatus Lambdaproteobacteria bacterium]|nr:thiolase family protein [Candidatus Lambdaproteobacteria bacterium]
MSDSLRNKVIIAGVGESDIGKVPAMTGLGLNAQAAKRALDDAGMTLRDIDGVLTAYTMTEPYFMLGTVVAEYLGLRPRYCASIAAGGASPAVMLKHAAEAIAAGSCETVLICAGENRATGQSRDSAVAALTAVGHPYFENLYGPLVPGFYAMIARRYMHEVGIRREQMAAVAVNGRNHALRHPNAHMKTPISIADVLASKPIAEPLNLLDCCLISDAAGALIVTRAERARDLPRRPAWLLGIGEHHTHEHLLAAPSLTEFGAKHSGAAAYCMAGLGPGQIDFAQLYDCFTIVPMIEMEELGLCERGASGALFESGATAIEGSLPVNTDGGLLSHAQAGAGGGIFGFVEATRQLRGDQGPRQVSRHEVALVHNEGGVLSSHCTAILASRPG